MTEWMDEWINKLMKSVFNEDLAETMENISLTLNAFFDMELPIHQF